MPMIPHAANIVWLSKIRRLGEAQGWRCCYCGVRMSLGIHCREGKSATIEHVVPRVAGGTDDWDNLVAACRLCNNARSSMKAEKFLRFVLWKGREKAARYAFRVSAKIQRKSFRQKISPARVAAATPAAIPIEYDDPQAQAAFEQVYKDRLHLLRDPFESQ